MMWKVSNNFEDFYLFDLEILGSSKVWLPLLLAHSFWHLKRTSEIRIRIIVWVAFIRDVQIVPVSESWPLVVIVTDRRLMVVLFYLEFSFVTDREQKSFTVFKPATFWSPGYRLKATPPTHQRSFLNLTVLLLWCLIGCRKCCGSWWLRNRSLNLCKLDSKFYFLA